MSTRTSTAIDPTYVPAPGSAWERRRPDEVGMDAARLEEAAAFSVAHETPWSTDLRQVWTETNASEGQYGVIIGPTKPRSGVNGLVLRRGYVVAEWGNTTRVDMTFSASKSYLATVAGLALDDGLIRDLDEPVRDSLDPAKDDGFESPQNRTITWRHLLQQTSEWEGTLWGKPDQVDRNRAVGPEALPAGAIKGAARPLREPGTYWEYNDVRVNRLSLALLRLWRRPLPDVLRERIMRPIGASDTWEWHGYENSYVSIDSRRIQSVSGGGHWGGGLWISSQDHARFGQLHLRRGRWNGRQLLSECWLETLTTPCPINPVYGALWWLNTGRTRFPSASESSFFAQGAGNNIVWIEPEHDLVVVVRWLAPNALDPFFGRVLASISS